MAIQILIDGYNLIGSEKGLTGNLKPRRDLLIQQLQQYQDRKGYPITVVFDGWRSGWVHEVEEKHGAITVIFSQQGEKADSVVERLARELGNGCVVVTSDREVRNAVEQCGAVAIYAGEFGSKLRNLDREIWIEEGDEELMDLRNQSKRGNPRKLSKTERKRRERLKKL